MKFSIPLAASILAAVTPSFAFSPAVGVAFWDGPQGTGNRWITQNDGGCQNMPSDWDNRAKSVGIYPTGYYCSFWADWNCNNNGNDARDYCGGKGGPPASRGPGTWGLNAGCQQRTSSFKCYKGQL